VTGILISTHCRDSSIIIYDEPLSAEINYRSDWHLAPGVGQEHAVAAALNPRPASVGRL
jgi:hypothetical protein